MKILMTMLLNLLIIFAYTSNAEKTLFHSKVNKSHNLSHTIKGKKFLNNNKQFNNDYVEITPDEISYSEENNSSKQYNGDYLSSNLIYNKKLYEYDLEKQEIPSYYHNPTQYVYSKDDNPYYNPGRTFKKIPKPRNPKFITPIKLEKMDHDIYIKTRNKKDLEAYLIELEKELYKLLLFIDEPKYLNTIDKKEIVNDKYPYSYYDPTRLDRIVRIKELKKKILSVKNQLGLNSDVELFVTVKNSTFPRNSEDIVSHYFESYSIPQKHENKTNVINGNLVKLEDVYNVRKVHLINNNAHKQDNPLEDLSKLNFGYDNQILAFIKKQNKKQEEISTPKENNNRTEPLNTHLIVKDYTETSQQGILKNALMNNFHSIHNQLEAKLQY